MLRRLHTKMALILVGLFMLLGSIFAALIIRAADLYQQELHQKLNFDLARHIAAHPDLPGLGTQSPERFETFLETVMALNPSVEVYLTDPDGRIFAHPATAGQVRADRIDLEPVKRFLSGAKLPILGTDPRHPDRRKIFSAAPVNADGDLQGYLYVVTAGEQHQTIASMLRESWVLKLSLGTAAGGLLIAVLAAVLIFAMLTRRLRRLASVVDGFRASRFHQCPESLNAPPRGTDEIARLALSFEQMARQITTQMDQLKENDRLRRELVANVSHDLRTPLASLQGYLETLMLKQGSLCDQQERDYLETAARHGRHLSSLVSELFELARLDSIDILPEVKSFPLADLVQDLVQKLDPPAREAGVRISAQVDVNAPFINANLQMIERVLENLLDNSLRNTPPGGRIDLAVFPGGRGVRVQVSDTGRGVAKQDLPHIFKRFHRPREAENQGDSEYRSGLGLAIAARILELHGSRIEIASETGSGTIIAFDLPTGDR